MNQTSLGAMPNDLTVARDRILATVQAKPQSVTELAKALGKKPPIGKNAVERKNLARQIIESLKKENRVFEHPRGGRNRTVKIGLTPADPQKYISKTKLDKIQPIYERLIASRVPPVEVLNVVGATLQPPVASLVSNGRGNGPVADNANTSRLREQLLKYLGMRSRPSAVDCPLRELYEEAAKPSGASIGEFHDAIRSLWDEGKIHLASWTHPLYTLKDERYALVADKEIRFYAGLAQ